ncbi:TPA: hypothetical protein ACP7Q5_004795 [Escherichia coli]|jgi:benzoyl-CoA reductase/2-hydroxyglutaryl-CoA dehydratase subunit BcrC/BadD/HgdB|nr:MULTISPECIES: hypothetical protein [Bacilli]ELG7156071.1 hypothetical protein [Staphylococcus aureus]MCM3755218.1 hypothetical protein [Bacillus licheniformis]HDW3906860.1 hypothetical protein [Escherichia coli]ELL1200989.1 hypothetical protein [Staphylococcus aureus]MDH9287440.1 hypothetical protein [Staphylococcus epidermidis]
MNELWENPLYTVEERLEMAVGGILFRDRCLKQAYERLNQANQRLREVAELAHAVNDVIELFEEFYADSKGQPITDRLREISAVLHAQKQGE